MNIQKTILHHIELACKTLSMSCDNIELSHPVDSAHGDYTSNLALQIYHQQKNSDQGSSYQNPREVAEALLDVLQMSNLVVGFPSPINKIEVAGPGYLNFYLTKYYFVGSLEEIIQNSKEYGSHTPSKDQEYIVEYSSPNIAKPFTIGHFRSTIIGDALANIIENTGQTVYRDNHVGDWGTQFGKLLYAIKTWGDEAALASVDNPIKELVSLYVRFHEEAEQNPALNDLGRAWFKRLESGDAEALRLWKLCIDWSYKTFNRVYDRLGIRFTENEGRGYGEAFFQDKMQVVLDLLKSQALLTESEGAQLVFFPEEMYPPLMIMKKDGATLYATRDLATDYWRKQTYGQDVIIINEVGNEQALYFKQLYQLEQMMGWYTKEQRIHIGHGMYRFKDGKMSTRKGNVIWLEDVLQEATQRVIDAFWPDQKVDVELAEQVAIGALKYNDLKSSPERDIAFDWNEIISLHGNSGPYLQYTHARAAAILRKVDAPKSVAVPTFLQDEELEVLRYLTRYPEITLQAAEQLSTHVLCTYLYDLAQRFNRMYAKLSILQAEDDQRKEFRVALSAAVRQVLSHGLTLLGIAAPQKL